MRTAFGVHVLLFTEPRDRSFHLREALAYQILLHQGVR
jgi:hypothetical protein